jgi:2-keto-4-pentenoate hydratase/2-oxohepta-3-ene-1,7-dioic acid hydratase in catechol pathway
MTFQIPGLPHLEIGTIYCIGRNYAEHAHELNNPVPGEPVIFIKPRSSAVIENGQIVLPAQSNDVHHEVELVLAVGKTGKNIPADQALTYIAGFGIGIDFTARDLQQTAKEKGLPWSVAKGFDTFSPIGTFIPVSDADTDKPFTLELKVNGEVRQKGTTSDMLFPIPELISRLSRIFTLYEGDLIFTGTPKGVSRISKGDKIEAMLGQNLSTLKLNVQ